MFKSLPAVQKMLGAGGALLFCAALMVSHQSHAAHAIALYGEPKYPAGFDHFAWVNPQAPRGGTLYLANPDRRTSFDKFNPFTLKGVSAPRVADLMFESLMTSSLDETNTQYGWLAEDVVIAPDGLSATFRLHPQARFNNGDAVTAQDVKYSFDTLNSKLAAPAYRSRLGEVKQAVVVNAHTIRYDFKQPLRELPFIVGGLPVFSPKWGQQADGKSKPFDKITFEKPIASGPYLIEAFQPGRRLVFKRNPAWWGDGLPTRRGMYNFDRVVMRMYGDSLSKLEAFKAGEYDLTVEYIAKNWARSYQGKKFAAGELIKRDFLHSDGADFQGFVMNLRRPQFADKRVRQALGLAFDFEWMNRQLFYNQYRRISSVFGGEAFTAVGKPSAEELLILNALRQQFPAALDPAVFDEVPIPPSTDAPNSLRKNLLKARELLAQAGWTYRDGALRNAKGQPFEFEFMNDQAGFEKIITPYQRNLEKLGITLKYRIVDHIEAQKRSDNFDFDMISQRLPHNPAPGTELIETYGSAAVKTEGSSNVLGLQNPAVDALITLIIASKTKQEVSARVKVLDRILRTGHYFVPHYYGATIRAAYSNKLGFVHQLPFYLDMGATDSWAIQTWWLKPAR